MGDTHEQKLARGLDRHLVVTANAGSGKTRVLVGRYIDIILSGTDPRHAVAITFTRKAAAEMKARVAVEIDKMYKAATDSDELTKLKRIREKLTNSRITTIHSFCAALLRDYPIEAGLSPNFTELGEADKHRIRKDSITSALEDWLTGEDPVRKENATDLFRIYGRETLEEYLGTIIDKAEIFEEISSFYDGLSSDAYNDLADKAISGYLLPGLNYELQMLQEICGDMDVSKLKKDKLETFTETSRLISDTIGLIKNNKGRYSQEILLRIFSNCPAIIDFFFTKTKLTLRKDVEKLISEPVYIHAIGEIPPKLKESLAASESYRHLEQQSLLYRLVTSLIEISSDVYDIIELQKESLGCIDFNDMMLKAHKLLQDKDVCDSVRGNIKFLLVDEFQDTNALQYEIIKLLIPELQSGNINKQGSNLFIVGDAKQSIYRFRDADVRVFKRAANDIVGINSERLKNRQIPKGLKTSDGIVVTSTESERLGDVKLSVSFRLKPVIAAFVNHICEKLMNREKGEYEVAYSPLVCARDTDILFEKSSGTDKKLLLDETLGSINFLFTEKPPRDADESEHLSEPQLLAGYINSIVSPDSKHVVRDGDEDRLVKYSDIAILARNRNGFSDLTRELQAASIPYIVHSGGGFYDAPEVMDIISYLNFLHNSNDDISLAATLRSPFFGLSDADIFRASLAEKTGSLWEKFNSENIEKIPDDDFGVIENALSTLNRMAYLAPRIPVSRLIISMLEESAWYGTLSGKRAAAQMEANVDKLIQFARDFERRGFRNLYDFVEEIEQLKSNGSSEGEAVFLTGENAVNIMTIHASKGLEFPVIVLYKSNFTGNNRQGLINSSEFGITFPVPYDTQSKARAMVTTPIHYLNISNEKQADIAEEKRLLYVALTRAKDHLVISGMLEKNPKAYLKMIIDSIGLDPDMIMENVTGNLSIAENLSFLHDNQVKRLDTEIPVGIIIEIPEISDNPTDTDIETHSSDILYRRTSSNTINDFFSATKMMTFMSDKKEYIKRYRLGLPSSDDFEMHSPPLLKSDDGDGIVGTLAGTLIHECLESVKNWLSNDGKFNEEKLKSEIENIIKDGERNTNERIKARILSECRAVASSPLLGEYTKNIQTSRSEYTMYMPYKEDILAATIDLLIQSPSGNWEVWDWKTNRVNNASDMDSLWDYYETQLKIYSYLTSFLYPDQEEYTARLLFTRVASHETEDKDWTRSKTWTKKELTTFGTEIGKGICDIKDYVYSDLLI